jgi:hypothetical protein
MGDTAVRGQQNSLPGNDIVKEVVVADKGPEGIERLTLLPAILEEAEVQKIIVGKHGKCVLGHSRHPLS